MDLAVVWLFSIHQDIHAGADRGRRGAFARSARFHAGLLLDGAGFGGGRRGAVMGGLALAPDTRPPGSLEMGIRYRMFTGLLLILLLLAPAAPAYAREAAGATRDGKVIFGEDYVLKDGETLDGDLVVFGGNVSLESGSVVRGSV